ncbi:coiled-coil domain-containing protein [Litchfieldia salsa]|uniref:N-terminal domain of peptidoglycan hydrolase CwlO-containing protein n=1 Tax=Litchfieldia salsa TaxID=930152 RepID=A0A1H0W9F4_9BACI|nr:C40 family peptidase [Litchfieldia salsa]SDP87364.1 N-terminal domain of peptidoglycan hydrolase CwlO-containing protein [Litchfieldia salsa]
MFRKKLVVINTAIVIGLSSFAMPTVFAETPTQINEERSAIQSELNEAVEHLMTIQVELDAMSEQFNRVDKAVADNEKMIADTKKEIETVELEIKALEEEMAVLQETIDQRFNILKERAITLQQSGGSASYLEVIVGSTSFNDFVDRVFAVLTIAQADTDLLKQQKADQKELEEKQGSVEKKLEDLTSKKVELEGMQAQILEQKKQNDLLKNELEGKRRESQSFLADLQKKDRDLAAKAASMQQSKSKSENSSSTSQVTNIETTQEVSGVISESSSSGNKSLNEAISSSYRYIGNSVYVFGGGRNSYDITNGRFDCSGFVSYVFSQAGIRVGASTSSLRYAGQQIPTNQMQYGDLVFFDTYKKDGHVGIYVGGGKFIGSQNSTGVAVADMTSGYWKQKFNGRVVRVN